MRSNQHTKFIMTPISDTLNDSVRACLGLGYGIETHPLSEYVFQTTFLKMTGASEQKLKCICWEMATYDYEYRYKKLSSPLGECSSYDDKKKIFAELIEEIKKLDSSFNPATLFSEQNKQNILNGIRAEFNSALDGSVMTVWDNRSYANQLVITDSSFAVTNGGTCSLLNNDLISYYKDTLYRHRNRCAHNLRSYQQNTPTLSVLAKSKSGNDNYFDLFFVLILIDNIFMTAYKEYLNSLDSVNL